MKIRYLLAVMFMVAFLGMQAGPASADALTPGTWQMFFFSGPDSFAGTFTGTFAEPTSVRVTDGFLYGDTFKIVVNSGAATWYTSTPGTGAGLGTDGDSAWADPAYSHGIWTVAAGTYQFDIYAVLSPWGSGGAFIRADSPPATVPLPGALLLFGPGLVGLTAIRRRFKK